MKKCNSKWLEGTRTKSWLKIKNWKYVNVILTGFSEEQNKTLIAFFKMNGTLLDKSILEIPPSICITVACTDFYGSKLREPRFHSVQHRLDTAECNWRQMKRQLNPIPENVIVTSPDKPVFLQDRLLTVIRYPHGVPGESFNRKTIRKICRIL